MDSAPSTPAVCSLFLRSPFVVVVHPRRGTLRFARRRPIIQRSSDVWSDAQIGITVILANTVWVCLWTVR
uniref:Uncharacterized protein n=1 Tax=Zea mays TaxID=4577 RepID=A0A804Q8I3_MAIZE